MLNADEAIRCLYATANIINIFLKYTLCLLESLGHFVIIWLEKEAFVARRSERTLVRATTARISSPYLPQNVHYNVHYLKTVHCFRLNQSN